jgi:hypothetical protein
MKKPNFITDLESFQSILEEYLINNNSFETAKRMIWVYQITDVRDFTVDKIIPYWNHFTEVYFNSLSELESKDEFELCHNVMKFLEQERDNLKDIYTLMTLSDEMTDESKIKDCEEVILKKLDSIYRSNKIKYVRGN